MTELQAAKAEYDRLLQQQENEQYEECVCVARTLCAQLAGLFGTTFVKCKVNKVKSLLANIFSPEDFARGKHDCDLIYCEFEDGAVISLGAIDNSELLVYRYFATQQSKPIILSEIYKADEAFAAWSKIEELTKKTNVDVIMRQIAEKIANHPYFAEMGCVTRYIRKPICVGFTSTNVYEYDFDVD